MRNESLYFTEVESSTDDHARVAAGEELTFDVTEDILIIMEDKDISKKELADKLGKTKAYVSQLLSGSKNMTLRTLSDVCHAIGIKPAVHFQDNNEDIISDNMSARLFNCDWQEYFTLDDRDTMSDTASDVVTKSNVIYKTEKAHWQKVAA
ncbi:helix-turn-helix transcriptional regulator [Erwinia sp. Leaf53]|uniref:helix-turn-helix domain-containing protein n=1 Tax=Erwinia sp. Leaf53 TaxID=1736225 RepID=UPI0006FD00AA|nr:helix-turn-helix transcriptional regulator [Erwinia sp. Leaf53]KQN53181.1 hypothetical protein ASF13_16415 [Erwinia sp. Leaf53]